MNIVATNYVRFFFPRLVVCLSIHSKYEKAAAVLEAGFDFVEDFICAQLTIRLTDNFAGRRVSRSFFGGRARPSDS